MEVFITSPWVPAEWVKAHGLEPRGVWAVRDFDSGLLPLTAGVCAFAEAAVRLTEAHTEAAFIFTTHCDQLRRGFDGAAQCPAGALASSPAWAGRAEHAGAPGAARVFLFNLPATAQTVVARRMFVSELERLSDFLVELGGHSPKSEALWAVMLQYGEARRRLLEAAPFCLGRQYAEAVARFHWDGSVNLMGSVAEPELREPMVGVAEPEKAQGGPHPRSPSPSDGEGARGRGVRGRPGLTPVPPLHRMERGQEEEVIPTILSQQASTSRTSDFGLRTFHSVPLALVGGPLPRSRWGVLDMIERAGGRVVLNATEGGERSLLPFIERPARSESASKLDALQTLRESRCLQAATEPANDLGGCGTELLARQYLEGCVDVFQRPNTRLYAWLKDRLSARGVRGILLWHYVGCDLWRAEAQSLREAFGLPLLLLEASEAPGDSQRNAGRIEAFLEGLKE